MDTMNILVFALRHMLKLATTALLLVPLWVWAAAADNTIGAIVMHGKWGSPQRVVLN